VDCGLVVEEEEIDHGPGWRAFDSRERDEKSRVGARSSNLPAMRTSSLRSRYHELLDAGTDLSAVP
jgi:transcription initiation factor TFIIIB Brf1 subunit/transcription initiation factor TFIIB